MANLLKGPGKVIGGAVLKLERVQVICPACGEQVEAVASDGRVKGYCAVARQYVDFPAETQRVRIDKHHTAETRAKMSAAHTGKHPTAETRAKISASLTRWHNRKGGNVKRCSSGSSFAYSKEHEFRHSSSAVT